MLDRDALQTVAVAYLSRYAASKATLLRLLERRIRRWAEKAQGPRERIAADAAQARLTAAEIVDAMAAAGMVDDASFARSRARSLARTGRSKRRIAGYLIQRGINPAMAKEAVAEDGDDELAAALAFARRRRIGPYRRMDDRNHEARQRELATFARAGFPVAIARAVLNMALDEAEPLVAQLRRD
ncbi:MAG: RecX family transcriptional regulator [Acetobacteraceae bacterium]|nr:RecX family transcriptional regulator [Acetobacteraceae bacterium]MBV8524526.1 RecX family transcriptional regulator [Acetobacteraceae bacterium]MBV8588609.1 RecX family transcriptional regulator [Acetobacteraceae bacterium]